MFSSGFLEQRIREGPSGNGQEDRGKKQRPVSHRGDNDARSADFASSRGCCGSFSGPLRIPLLPAYLTGTLDHAGEKTAAYAGFLKIDNFHAH